MVDLRPCRFLARIDMRSAFSSSDLSISFGGSGGGGGGKIGIGAGGGGLGGLGENILKIKLIFFSSFSILG